VKLYQQISLLRGSAVDAEARIYLQALPGCEVQEIRGQLYGPHCEFAHTLPATFAALPAPDEAGAACLTELFVPDPCFWTPQLPFRYDLKLEVTTKAGESTAYETSIGLKRWSVDNANWKLEGKRVVLRGAKPASDADNFLAFARKAEVSLLVSPPEELVLVSANRIGVPLVVDLRSDSPEWDNELDRLSWSPSVMAVLLSADQLGNAQPAPRGLPIGLVLDDRSHAADVTQVDCHFYAIELRPGERPPAWLASDDKPVIAIRREVEFADLAAAREACDRLQAELAPEFDLAGYFVAP